jgi:DNA replication and repair protein RecF
VAALAAELALAYEREAGQEVMRGATLVGPHRDDVELALNGSSLRTFGSQGQQRTAALALRLAENEYLCRVRQDTPLLLLDDVFSELDESRRGALLALLGRRAGGAQTFLAATDVQNLPPLAVAHAALFRVEGGVVSLAHGAV